MLNSIIHKVLKCQTPAETKTLVFTSVENLFQQHINKYSNCKGTRPALP